MRERIVWIVLLLIGTGGGFYAGRLNGIQVGQTQVQQTANRFFATRGGAGGAGGAAGNGAAGGTRRGTFQGQNLVGTVDKVDGSTITIKAFNNTSAKIQLNADATIRKQVDGQISDIHPGDRVVANGTKNGDVFQATSVQIGGRLGGGNQNGGNQSAGQ